VEKFARGFARVGVHPFVKRRSGFPSHNNRCVRAKSVNRASSPMQGNGGFGVIRIHVAEKWTGEPKADKLQQCFGEQPASGCGRGQRILLSYLHSGIKRIVRVDRIIDRLEQPDLLETLQQFNREIPTPLLHPDDGDLDWQRCRSTVR
jgi:hypothetical protein